REIESKKSSYLSRFVCAVMSGGKETLARTQKRALRKQRYQANERRAAAATDIQSQSFAPHSVHTHVRQPTYSHKSFRDFLDRRPVLCERTDSDEAYRMADYCTQSIATLSSVLRVLNHSETAAN